VILSVPGILLISVLTSDYRLTRTLTTVIYNVLSF